jgi:anti-anti-sigma regulatory factor
MADIQRTRSGNKERVSIRGDLTVPHANALRTVLLEAMKNAEAIVLAVDQVTALDVSFPQLVCSAHRTAASLGKELTITGLEQDRLAQLLLQAGFMRHTGCAESTRKTCLWLRSECAN